MVFTVLSPSRLIAVAKVVCSFAELESCVSQRAPSLPDVLYCYGSSHPKCFREVYNHVERHERSFATEKYRMMRLRPALPEQLLPLSFCADT